MTALYDTAPPTASEGCFSAATLKTVITSTCSALLIPLLRRVAADRIGGETLEEAWRVVVAVQSNGASYSLGFWDTPAYAPDDILVLYLQALECIGLHGGGYLSIKPPALHFDGTRARTLALAARQAGVRLHCDSHGTNVADLTLDFAERLQEHLPGDLVSVTIPGRWERSCGDALRMEGRGIGVRVVKGQWPDPSNPGLDLGGGFIDVVDALATGRSRLVLASHDAALLARASGRLSRPFEIEFIHGLQTDSLMDLAHQHTAPVTIYVPYGKGFAPSALGILRRNPRLFLSLFKSMAVRRAQSDDPPTEFSSSVAGKA